ncbi:MAG: lipopolysaccharide kinase InaA family protein [Planctomycetota bacterium]|nr:lipopolysaccharide kinase InaA family protein [Planctomycetota bacterium]
MEDPNHSSEKVGWNWVVPLDDALQSVADAFAGGELPADYEVIKERGRRQIWRAPKSAGGLLLKHFTVGSWESWRSLVWPSRAGRETQMMLAFQKAGIPTVEPVGFAERRKSGRVVEGWFLGRLVPNSRTLSDVLDGLDEVTGKEDVLSSAMSVVATMHQHPFLHRDLHAGNLLVEDNGHVLITDLHSAWRVPRLTRRMRVANLGELLFSLRGVLRVELHETVLGMYAKARGEDLAELVRDVHLAMRRFEQDYVRGRVARCMRNSTEFEKVKDYRGGRVWHRRSYSMETLGEDLSWHEKVAGEGGPDLLGDAPHRQVVRTPDGRVIKSYRRCEFHVRLRNALGRGRARSAWIGAREMIVRGLPTPEPLALVEFSSGVCFLVTRMAEGAALPDVLREGCDRQMQNRLIRSTGWIVGCLSRAGLRHRDINPWNVFISREVPLETGDLRTEPSPDLCRLTLIDLDSMHKTPPYDPAALQRMLGQILDREGARLTRGEHLRFCRAYESAAGCSIPEGVAKAALSRVEFRRSRRRKQQIA